jgi:hypothetical protein
MKSSIEILEARIAPATLLNPKTVSYVDVDGDDVVIKIFKGSLDLATNFIFSAGGAGEQLEQIILTDAEFAGAKVTVTAKRNAALGGNGLGTSATWTLPGSRCIPSRSMEISARFASERTAARQCSS